MIQGLSPCVLLSDHAAEGCIEKKQKVFLTFTEQGLLWLDVAPRLTPLGSEVFLSIRLRILLSSSMLSHLPPGDMGKPHFTKVIKNMYVDSQNTGVGSLSLLQGIFPTQGSNPGLLHCRQILYQLSHKGNPDICSRFDSTGVSYATSTSL